MSPRVRQPATTSAVDCDWMVLDGHVTGDVATATTQSGNSLVGMSCATTKTLTSWSKALQGKRVNAIGKHSTGFLSAGQVP